MHNAFRQTLWKISRHPLISQASPEGFLISVTEYGQKNRHDVEEKELKEFLRLQNLASKDDKQSEGMLHKLNILKKKRFK